MAKIRNKAHDNVLVVSRGVGLTIQQSFDTRLYNVVDSLDRIARPRKCGGKKSFAVAATKSIQSIKTKMMFNVDALARGLAIDQMYRGVWSGWSWIGAERIEM